MTDPPAGAAAAAEALTLPLFVTAGAVSRHRSGARARGDRDVAPVFVRREP
jgi:hypothetical protein